MAEILVQDIGFWLHFFENLCKNETFKGNEKAQSLINKGHSAIANDDAQGLKECVRALMSLLPREDRVEFESKISGITR